MRHTAAVWMVEAGVFNDDVAAVPWPHRSKDHTGVCALRTSAVGEAAAALDW
jgi:hypothetical protein